MVFRPHGSKLKRNWRSLKLVGKLADPGETFLDRMIARAEGAERQKIPNETEAPFDPFHQIASVPFELHALAELRRHYDLEHLLVPGRLPGREPLCPMHSVFSGGERDGFHLILLCCSFPSYIVAMCLPLAVCFVTRMRHAHGTTLAEFACTR